MGKKTKTHRAKVAARAQRIKQDQNTFINLLKKASKVKEAEAYNRIVKDNIKGAGFLPLTGSDADKYQL
jgi:hypothetical protein